MRKEIKGFIDQNGEIHEGDGVPVWVGKKTHFTKLYGRDWMVVAQNAFALMAMDTDLTLEPKNILMYLFSRLDFENYIQVPQIEISEALNIKKQNVNRSVKLLETKGILIRGPKVGRSSSWRLNPNYGFKGNPRGKVSKDIKSGHLRLISSN